jgi:hypothetical protein
MDILENADMTLQGLGVLWRALVWGRVWRGAAEELQSHQCRTQPPWKEKEAPGRRIRVGA